MQSLDIDLLEEVEIYELFKQYDLVNETTIAGVKITKENLQDEKFVKDLIKKIDEKDTKSSDLSLSISGLGLISSLTIIGIPIGILLFTIARVISKQGSSKNNLEKLENCIDETISKLNKEKSKITDTSKIKEYDSVIAKLQKSKKSIHDGEIFIDMSNIDKSKYDKDGNIKINSKVSIRTIISEYFTDNKNITLTKKEAQSFNDRLNKLQKVKTDSCFENNIELFAVHKIINNSDLLKCINNMKDTQNNTIQKLLPDHGNNVNKLLKGKNLAMIYTEQDYLAIVYSYDDDCCYYWGWDNNNYIEKISVSDLLKASKTAYDDLMKVANQIK